MKSLLQMFETPFGELPLEQQILLVILLVGCIGLAGWAVLIAARRLRERRRNPRRQLNNPVEVSWQDSDGLPKSVSGQCVDSSAGGMRVDLPCPLEIRTRVEFRVLGVGAVGSAVVRNCAPAGQRYSVGLEFNGVHTALSA